MERGGRTSSRKRQRGNVKRGGRLESLILKTANYLARNQIARIWKWPVEVRLQPVKRLCPTCHSATSSQELIYAARTGFDFFGYTAKGRVIAIEAKEEQGDRLRWNIKDGAGVKRHQLDALQEVKRAGGIAFVLWMRQEEVRLVDVYIDRGQQKSMPWGYGAPIKKASEYLDLIDWLV